MLGRIASCVLAVVASALFAGSVAAAELTGAEISSLLTGKTAYIEFAASTLTAAGAGAIYYSPQGKVAAKLPDDKKATGVRTIKGNTFCVAWADRPVSPCSKLEKDGDTYKIINAETGELRGTITKIVDGNPD
jgi:hypothetical protein